MKIYLERRGLYQPTQEDGSAGIDIHVSKTTTLEPGKVTIVPTGLVVDFTDDLDLEIQAEVLIDNKVQYKNKTYTLSELEKKLCEDIGKNRKRGGHSGLMRWFYNDKPLITLMSKNKTETESFSFENVGIKPGNIITFKVKNERDAVLLLYPRSSLSLKKGLLLANSVGVIDSTYNGPNDKIGVLLYNTTDKDVVLQAGEKVAQLILTTVHPGNKIEYIGTTDELKDKEDRGGFGSTGGYSESNL